MLKKKQIAERDVQASFTANREHFFRSKQKDKETVHKQVFQNYESNASNDPYQIMETDVQMGAFSVAGNGGGTNDDDEQSTALPQVHPSQNPTIVTITSARLVNNDAVGNDVIVDAIPIERFCKTGSTLRYMLIAMVVLVLLIAIIIPSVILTRQSGAITPNDAPTFAPTSLQDSAYFKLFAQSLDYQEWQFTEDSPYGRAAKWIMEEDERKLSQYDESLVQRFLLAVFYFITTSNGQLPWRSCNPDFTNSSNDICDFETYTINAEEEVEYIPKPSYRWLSKVHECDWAGNLCDDLSITRAIDLLGQKITGTLPTELVAFPFLRSIALAFNEFTGTLPVEYASPDKARHLINLEVHGNQLTGTIPKEYYLAKDLQNLNVGQNYLTGTLSSEIGFLTNLKGFHTFSNMISGPIPTEIGKLDYLAFTQHSENMYNGTIPTEFGNLLQIQEVWLGMNYFTGSIPSELGLLTDMTDLRVFENKLEGTIPSELYSLSKLRYLFVHSNFLSGTISTRMGNLAAINGLWLARNQLTGTIPTELGSLYSMDLLWLHSNKLVGSVPTEICALKSTNKDIILLADCFPVGNEANPCACCTTCCSRETKVCF